MVVFDINVSKLFGKKFESISERDVGRLFSRLSIHNNTLYDDGEKVAFGRNFDELFFEFDKYVIKRIENEI